MPASVPKAQDQMGEYMAKVADLPNREEHLQGFLVVGNLVKRYWLENHSLAIHSV